MAKADPVLAVSDEEKRLLALKEELEEKENALAREETRLHQEKEALEAQKLVDKLDPRKPEKYVPPPDPANRPAKHHISELPGYEGMADDDGNPIWWGHPIQGNPEKLAEWQARRKNREAA